MFADIRSFGVGDFRRYKGPDYTFVIPKRWVGDTGLELAKVQRRAKTLDYGMKQSSGSGVLPNAGECVENSLG